MVHEMKAASWDRGARTSGVRLSTSGRGGRDRSGWNWHCDKSGRWSVKKGYDVGNDKGKRVGGPERVMCEAVKKMPSGWD